MSIPSVGAPPGSEMTPLRENLARAPAASRPHLLDYVRVLSRRRGTAGTAFLVVVTMVAIYVFTARPVYEARARLLIDPVNANVVNFKEVMEQDRGTADYYQTQYKLLQNRPLVKKTIDTLALWGRPEFGAVEGAVSVTGRVKALVNAGVTAVTRPFTQPGGGSPGTAPETAREVRVVDAFLAHLNVSPVRNSRLVDVKFESTDPALAAKAANALVNGFIEQALEQKFGESRNASDWLGRELEGQRRVVETRETALQQYRESHDAMSLDERQNIVVQKLADLNAAVTRAKTARIEKQAAYDRLRAIENDRAALDTFPAVSSNAFIQQMKGELVGLQRQQAQLTDRYGERHPELIKIETAIQNAQAKLHAEIAKVVESIRNDYLVAQAQERELLTALEVQKREALELNKKGIEYAALQREAASTRQVFESLLQRVKETDVSADLRTSHVRIVEAADVPHTPARPNKTNALLGGLLGGGLFAIGLAFLFEYVDDRVKTPEEIKTHLGLGFLGLLPAIPEDVTKTNPTSLYRMLPVFTEALRTVRTNVLFAFAERGSRSVLVTSAGPGEGKTAVATNLAIALAQAGQRVLLIDADMRRPRVHGVFALAAEPGLSNLLVGDAKPSQVIRKASVPDLWVVPAGRPAPNPAELLGRAAFTEFLASLGTHFEWVVIDSPPVQAVADASVIAHVTSGVLFVIGAEMTSRRTAQAALEQLESAHATVIGAVLNRVDLKRNAYYYSRYYRRSYSQYYEQRVAG